MLYVRNFMNWTVELFLENRIFVSDVQNLNLFKSEWIFWPNIFMHFKIDNFKGIFSNRIVITLF